MTSTHEITGILARLADTRDQVTEMLIALHNTPDNEVISAHLRKAYDDMNQAVYALQDARITTQRSEAKS